MQEQMGNDTRKIKTLQGSKKKKKTKGNKIKKNENKSKQTQKLPPFFRNEEYN